MDLFAVFIRHGRIVGGARVGSQDDAVFINEAYDCGSGFERLGQLGGDGGVGGRGVGEEGVAMGQVEGEAGGGRI